MRPNSSHFAYCLLLALLSTQAEAEPEEIYVGDLISRVMAGEDFTGEELVLTGIALNETTREGRLVKLGTAETYQSGAYSDFVSIYETRVIFKEADVVRVTVVIDISYALREEDEWSAIIEATFIDCDSCDSWWR